ncbi:MAG: HAMP domain-containing sensor histidine kinase [Deltaproteobacteria bacterium]|nr:HAMP domain-containing sensor histidine kinase [Deltaproteobacteria bacterium]
MSVPATVTLAAFGFFAHEVARGALEDELGRRLAAAATGAAEQLLPEQIQSIGPGDENSRTYASIMGRLGNAAGRFGVRRFLVLAADGTARGDTIGRVALGAMAHELAADKDEFDRAMSGRAGASTLFRGNDGVLYKRGYAPIGQLEGAGPGIAGVVVAEGAADFYLPLSRFRRWLLGWGAFALFLLAGFTLWIARRITGPISRLADAASRIGTGDLVNRVPVETQDEIGLLAARLDDMRAALQARDERAQMMLAGIAHEVRNPLGGLELFAGLLREALSDQPERLREVARIDREVAYLKAVVDQFLDYARRPILERSAVDMGQLLFEVRDVAGADGPPVVVLDVESVRGMKIEVDAGQMRRALINLVRNARTAAGNQGLVVVAASFDRERGGQGFAIEVRDSGPGVEATDREKIFQPFFTTREKGTGLGLAFVRDIVRDHGGRVEVDKAREGGACFRLFI